MANKSVLSGIENRDRVVKCCIQTPSCGRIERSDFLGNRIDSSSESNRFELRIGMYYYLHYFMVLFLSRQVCYEWRVKGPWHNAKNW